MWTFVHSVGMLVQKCPTKAPRQLRGDGFLGPGAGAGLSEMCPQVPAPYSPSRRALKVSRNLPRTSERSVGPGPRADPRRLPEALVSFRNRIKNLQKLQMKNLNSVLSLFGRAAGTF